MAWSYKYFVETLVGKTQGDVAQSLPEENMSLDVAVITVDGRRRVAPVLWGCPKEIFDRLWARKEDPQMDLRFYRQRPGGAIIEVRPRRRAGTDLATRARALKESKRQAATPF